MTQCPSPPTYGHIVRGDGLWRVQAVPHVMIKLRRHFPRAARFRPGVITLRDAPEVARDLQWFIQRYPLAMDELTAAYLAARADKHRSIEQGVHAILGGYRPPDEWKEPARPARGYQQQAADIIHETFRLLIADDLGTGKTMSALLVLRNPDALPALVVAPTHLTQQWLAELAKTLPWLRGHIATKGTPYDLTKVRGAGGLPPDVLILTYHKLSGWAQHLTGTIRTVIFEEIHELRRGDRSAKGAAAYYLADHATYRVGCSATPIFNYGGDIWHVIRALDPDALGSNEEFRREWCGGDAGFAGHAFVKDPAALGTYLRDQGLIVCRTRKDLHMELPDPIQIEQEVDADRATIDQVAEDVAEQARILLGQQDATRTDRWRAAGEVDWRMRRATGLAKAPYVAEFVRLLLQSQQRVVLWGWHRDVYDEWLNRLRAFRPVLYTGSESPAQKAASVEAFCGGPSRVLIMSLRSGAGLDGLQEWCSVGVFGELDWSPEMHTQCIGRLDRPGQPATVVAYYMTSGQGTDPLMAEVLGLKRAQAVPVRQPDAPLFAGMTPDHDRARRIAADVLSRVHSRADSPTPHSLPFFSASCDTAAAPMR